MNLKSLSVKNKNHKFFFTHLNDKRIFKVFKVFSNSLNVKESLAVAISGGPDSLALAFLAKCHSLKNQVKVKYFIVDHKLRTESTKEAKEVKNTLKKDGINCKILSSKKDKQFKNIQSTARKKRFSLLIKECKKNNINNLLLGHHLDDLAENFLIRIVRGSGLNGLVSLDTKTKFTNHNFNIMRPLLSFKKKDLIYISKKVFNFYVKDPSNLNEDYKRTRIRNLLQSLENEGLDNKKLISTIDNLKDSNKTIKFYVEKNLLKNSFFSKKKETFILKKDFFDQPHEVVFRSLTKIVQEIGKKYYPVRGKSIDNLIEVINTKSFSRVTLGGCFIDRVNQTVLIYREK